MTELTDLSETDASNILITAINIDEGCAPSGINNAIRNTLGLIRRAFKTTIFRLRDSTDQTKLLAFDLSGLTTATTRTIIAPDESGRDALQQHLAGHIHGLTLSNNATDATNDIDIAAGTAIDTGNVHMLGLASAITKRLDATWVVGTNQGGLDSGVIANTTYHVYLIKRPDTGVVDVCFSTNTPATGPVFGGSIPAAYTLYRRIGSIIRVGGAIRAFTQIGDRFRLASGVTVRSNTSATAKTVLDMLTPSGIVTSPVFNHVQQQATAGSASTLFSSGDVVSPDAQIATTVAAGETHSVLIDGTFQTDTGRNIGITVTISSGTLSFNGTTLLGWIDRRGQD